MMLASFYMYLMMLVIINKFPYKLVIPYRTFYICVICLAVLLLNVMVSFLCLGRPFVFS